MIVWLRHLLGWVVSAFRSREDLVLENLALRQQLLALHAKRPRRRLTASQKLFWVALQSLWSRWKEPLILRPNACEPRGSRLSLSNGSGESHLGRAAHSWRAAHAGLRSVRANGFALDAEGTT